MPSPVRTLRPAPVPAPPRSPASDDRRSDRYKSASRSRRLQEFLRARVRAIPPSSARSMPAQKSGPSAGQQNRANIRLAGGLLQRLAQSAIIRSINRVALLRTVQRDAQRRAPAVLNQRLIKRQSPCAAGRSSRSCPADRPSAPGASSVQSFMQQKIQRAQIRHLEPLHFPQTNSRKMLFDPFGRDFANQNRIILRACARSARCSTYRPYRRSAHAPARSVFVWP